MTTYRISDYKIKLNCIVFIQNLDIDKEWLVTIEPYKKKRSVQQNKLYWKWLKEISAGCYEAGGELIPDKKYHLYFRQTLLGVDESEVNGISIWDLRSTTDLNTKEFTDYLENIEHYAGSEWGIALSQPVDLYIEAMGR